MSYYMNGVTIYRDAKMAEGFPVRPVPLSKAGAGDLLFFPGHVAVFIGGGRVIHSSSANGGVKTEPLSALPEPGAAGSVFGAEPSALRRAHLRLRR
jgi:cell wall-associated NlpC family hydrolase